MLTHIIVWTFKKFFSHICVLKTNLERFRDTFVFQKLYRQVNNSLISRILEFYNILIKFTGIYLLIVGFPKSRF